MLRDEGRRLADLLGNLALLLTFCQLTANEVGDLARRQFVALQILDNLVGLVVVVVDEGWNRGLVRPLRAAIAPGAMVDEISARRVLVLAHTDGWLHATVFDRLADLSNALRQETRVISRTRLIRVFIDQVKRQLQRASAASVGAIQRALLEIEAQGGDVFFGEPMLNIQDFMQTDAKGMGVINLLAADKLMNAPRLYGTFLLWMLSEMFEQLPEIGDVEKPKMVFFFDEAHLLFNEAPKVLLERIEQMVRLIRSKGVGVYFVTQNPLDVPETVLGQLGNRVQHALRAFTPRDQKAVKATAQTMRGKAGLDIEKSITELGVGEALVSLLDAKGRPSETEQVYVLLPGSQLGPITPEQRQALLANSLVAGVYEQTLDRESAYERLKGTAPAAGGSPATAGSAAGTVSAPAGQAPAQVTVTDQVLSGLGDALFGSTGPRGGQRQGLAQMMVKSAVRNIGSAVGREIVRGVMGSILGGRKR